MLKADFYVKYLFFFNKRVIVLQIYSVAYGSKKRDTAEEKMSEYPSAPLYYSSILLFYRFIIIVLKGHFKYVDSCHA